MDRDPFLYSGLDFGTVQPAGGTPFTVTGRGQHRYAPFRNYLNIPLASCLGLVSHPPPSRDTAAPVSLSCVWTKWQEAAARHEPHLIV
jgi:hypothetical protein